MNASVLFLVLVVIAGSATGQNAVIQGPEGTIAMSPTGIVASSAGDVVAQSPTGDSNGKRGVWKYKFCKKGIPCGTCGEIAEPCKRRQKQVGQFVLPEFPIAKGDEKENDSTES
ncbi:unnamed protein product [Orchesella dallaii]|uniref:Uncharacterized protein n=1 Tax=Orchesella dallaii TaxID=48710 RepID=A0ABP1RXJ7_9HEXA